LLFLLFLDKVFKIKNMNMKCWEISLVLLSIIAACSGKDEEYLNVETQEGTYT